MTFLTENLDYVLLGLVIAVVVLFITCVVTLVILLEQKKRYVLFMGSKRRPSHNLEMKLDEYFRVTKKVEQNYNRVLDMVLDMEENMRSNVQKVGLVRYNPFDEMGGNLCFALALLDKDNNGVVLNGIHSRTGSFTYAKPIQMGVSIYLLSDEEVEAVEIAKKQEYQPKHGKIMKVRFRKKYKKYDKQKVEAVPVMPETEDKKIEKSLGDVTSSEKEQIGMEQEMAEKIAAGDAINEDYMEELFTDEDLEQMMLEDDFSENSLEKEPTIEEMEAQMEVPHSAEELHELAKELAASMRLEEAKRKREAEDLAAQELSNTNMRRKVKMEKRVLVEEDDTKLEMQEAPVYVPKPEDESEI